MLKFSVITPCRNAERWIGETIESVRAQTALKSKAVQLEYLICDGGSTDRTVKIARSFDDPSIQIISEPDKGPYDALAKGLRRISGAVCSYINAGDLYGPHAFEIVAELFEFRSVRWVTGYEIGYNERSQLVRCILPFRFRNRLIQSGMYGTALPFVQQESTFWSSELNQSLDLERLAQLRLAGDHYLWRQFSGHTNLYIVGAHLGGFRFHSGQLSENKEEYFREMRSLSRPPTIVDYCLVVLDSILWRLPQGAKKVLNGKRLILFDHELQRWC